MSSSNAQWDNALKLLHEEVTEYQYMTWFKPLTPVIVGDDRMVFEFDDKFVMQTVRTRFYLLIKNAVMISYGKEYQIEFVFRGESPIFSKAVVTDIRTENDELIESMLNPKYTFDTFVVGASNRFAHAASLAVAELPADAYNPLFLYGGVGLGKTHLMHAIGHYIHQNNPNAKLMYITSENFTNQLITAIAQKTNQELRDRLRNVDVLMVDDIQFIAGKTATQEEFFHTFNELHGNGKQIIISSDRPPKDIPTIEDRLRSRFEWGLIVDIQKPDYETRVAILRKKADEEGIDVSYDVIDYIASHVESNIRELEGTLTRLSAQCQLMGTPITLEFAQNSLSQLMKSQEGRRITPELIISVVCDQYGVTQEDVISKKRSRDIAMPRQIAMYLCRDLTQLSTTNIGRAFGGRDHTTVMHGCDKIAEEMKNNFSFKKRIEELTAMVKNG